MSNPKQNEKIKKKGHKIKIIVAAILLLAVIFVLLTGFLTDWLWFRELGYTQVFFKKLVTQITIGVPTFIIVTMLVYVYLKALKSNYYHKIESHSPDRSKGINASSWGLAVIFGIGTTYAAVSKLWFLGLQCFNAASVGKKDPLFGLDSSFYMFKLDFIEALTNIIIGVLVALLLLTLVYYAILMSMRTPQMFEEEEDTPEDGSDPFKDEDEFEYEYGSDHGKRADGGKFGKFFDFGNLNKATDKFKNSTARKNRSQLDRENLHELLTIGSKRLVAVVVVLFIMIAVHFFLSQFQLLHSSTGTVYGAGFTDVNVTLWVYRVLILLALVGAFTTAKGIQKRSLKKLFAAPLLMVAVFLLGTVAGALVQNFVVSPDEISKESKYIERNIDFTQYAYNLSDVTVENYSADNGLDSGDIAENDGTISNIRINDYKPTQTYYNQTQSIRQYYTFNDVDVDRYTTNGEYTQTFLATREIDEGKISDTWINRHLKYTHGYGVTISRVDKVTESGQPDVLVGSVPPVSDVEEINITRPEVYFGELTNDYVIVNTDEEEFDYPDGDSNAYTKYEGEAGIKLNPLNRVLFAIKEHSMKLLVSSNVNSDSRIIINRNVMDRVEKIMPYLTYDEDPYMCTVDGKLYWIIDAYTTSSNMPYSQPYSENSDTNYIRNSVKVVVDAYDGSVNYYIVDETDAIAKTYANIYPSLFKSLDEMPEGIKEHIRYPATMFEIQAKIFEKYHVNDVKVFYQNEDVWDISNEIYGTEEQAMTANYYVMKLPGSDKEEFVNSIPYTPKDKKNMTGLLVARNDGEEYGKLVLYQLPKNKVVYGPMQVEAMIDQSTEISKEFSLWNSSGSSYSRGNMFIIPMDNGLLYVEPVYLEATKSSIPEVKRVIVVYGDKIAYEPTLSEALQSLFGGSAGTATSSDSSTNTTNSSDSDTESQAEIIKDAQEAYDNAQEAVADGDWAKYGEYMDQLEEDLNKLK